MSGKEAITLEQEYKDDRALLACYQKKLLEPGWAGELTDSEAAYIGAELSKSPILRGRWRKALRSEGYTGKRRKRPSIYVIKMWSEFLISAQPVE